MLFVCLLVSLLMLLPHVHIYLPDTHVFLADFLFVDCCIPNRWSLIYFRSGIHQDQLILYRRNRILFVNYCGRLERVCQACSCVFVRNNGCGKSTLLNCIPGHAHFDATISVNGKGRITRVAGFEISAYIFIGTPSLARRIIVKEAAKQYITKTLKALYRLKLVFRVLYGK